MSPDPVIVLTTVPDRQLDADTSGEAVGDALAAALVEEGLAACVNVMPPMRSVYRWQGTIERDVERQVVIKTTRDRVPAIQARLGQLHPYELPEFLVVTVAGGSEAYLDWMTKAGA
jgi:periplasmic divalent cation tolerance protein